MQHVKDVLNAGILGSALWMSISGCSAGQPQATPTPAAGAGDVLSTAGVLARLAERTPSKAAATGTAPSFVVDPGWPKPLPNNWIIGDVGGLYVDRHDHIWVYHRPRALDSTDAGALGEAGKDAKGNPISALGHPRPLRPAVRLLYPGAVRAASSTRTATLLQAWGGPGDPGFLEKRCRQQDGCFWPAREHGIYVDHNDFVYVAGNGQAAELPRTVSLGAELRQRFPRPEVQDGRHVRLSDRQCRREGPEQQRHQRRRSTARRSRFCRPT